jgi:hypothetical protein
VEQRGWLQIAALCKGVQTKHMVSNVRRGEVAGVVVMDKEVEGTKPKIKHQNQSIQNSVTDAMKMAVGSIAVDMPKDMINTRVKLHLNLELVCGPKGEWAISRAELQKQEPSRFEIKNLGHQYIGSSSRPISRQEWRPKAQLPQTSTPLPTETTRDLGSDTACPSDAECHADAKLREPVATHEVSDRVEGIWALQLRHGQRLFVPDLPPLPLSPNPFYALSSTVLEKEPTEQTGIPMEQTATWALENFDHTSSMADSEIHSSTCGDGSEWEEHAD